MKVVSYLAQMQDQTLGTQFPVKKKKGFPWITVIINEIHLQNSPSTVSRPSKPIQLLVWPVFFSCNISTNAFSFT